MKVIVRIDMDNRGRKFEYTGDASELSIDDVIAKLRNLAQEWQDEQPERFALNPAQGPLYKSLTGEKWYRWRDLFVVTAEAKDQTGELGTSARWQTDQPSSGYAPSRCEYLGTQRDEARLRNWYEKVAA